MRGRISNVDNVRIIIDLQSNPQESLQQSGLYQVVDDISRKHQKLFSDQIFTANGVASQDALLARVSSSVGLSLSCFDPPRSCFCFEAVCPHHPRTAPGTALILDNTKTRHKTKRRYLYGCVPGCRTRNHKDEVQGDVQRKLEYGEWLKMFSLSSFRSFVLSSFYYLCASIMPLPFAFCSYAGKGR